MVSTKVPGWNSAASASETTSARLQLIQKIIDEASLCLHISMFAQIFFLFYFAVNDSHEKLLQTLTRDPKIELFATNRVRIRFIAKFSLTRNLFYPSAS